MLHRAITIFVFLSIPLLLSPAEAGEIFENPLILGDLDGNQLIDEVDLSVCSQLLRRSGEHPPNLSTRADLNCDTLLDAADIGLFASIFLGDGRAVIAPVIVGGDPDVRGSEWSFELRVIANTTDLIPQSVGIRTYEWGANGLAALTPDPRVSTSPWEVKELQNGWTDLPEGRETWRNITYEGSRFSSDLVPTIVRYSARTDLEGIEGRAMRFTPIPDSPVFMLSTPENKEIPAIIIGEIRLGPPASLKGELKISAWEWHR